MTRTLISTLIAVLLLAVAPVGAELSKDDRKAIKSALKDGTLYMRMDAPCSTGRHAYGTYKRPLVEVSPEGSESDTSTELNVSFFHADSTYWGIRINDPVEFDEMDYESDEASIEIELEGVDSADGESTVIKLIDIHTMDDFQKAFDLAFARSPLQDEHDDWSADIKDAIARRELVNGMTKRQVFYITGSPEQFDKSEDGGKKIETWTLRTDKGMKMGFIFTKKKKEEGMPKTVRFEDGKLVSIGSSGGSKGLDLDN